MVLETDGVSMKIEIKIVPDGLDLATAIQDGTPVDKMDGGCPVATQDETTNMENKTVAIKDHNYGTAHPDSEERCGTCAAFNLTPEMKECMGDDTGEVGYCQSFKFMCSASNTCSAFVAGGPMTEMGE